MHTAEAIEEVADQLSRELENGKRSEVICTSDLVAIFQEIAERARSLKRSSHN